jgi:hypothetical protein
MRRLLPWFGIIVLTFIIYAQSLGNDFVTWDDRLLILDNPIVHGLSWANIFAAFTSYDPELYIPLTLLSYQMNYLSGGLQPFGYHLLNLILHIANAVLIFKIIVVASSNRSGESRLSATVAVAVALLFAIHPLHTEAVVWAAARKDVLSAFFMLLTVLFYLRSRERAPTDPSISLRAGGYANRLYVVSVLMFLFALLSKVSVILWPLVLPLMDWCRGDDVDAGVPHASRRAARSLQRAIPYAILSLIFGIVALGGKIANTGFLLEKFLIGCRAVTLLLQKFFWPTGLSAMYPFTKPIALATPEIFLSVLFVLFVSVLVIWVAWKKNLRLPLLAWGWFLLFLMPSFSNIMKGHNELLDIYITSDRYAYLPSIGLLFIGAFWVGRWVQRMPKLVCGAILFVLFVFSILSYRQSLIWKDTLSLFTHVATVQPQSYVAWSNIGTEETRRGNLNRGLEAYGKALAIRDDATTWYNVGQILRAQGKIPLAIEAYERAIASSPLEEDAKKALEELTR